MDYSLWRVSSLIDSLYLCTSATSLASCSSQLRRAPRVSNPCGGQDAYWLPPQSWQHGPPSWWRSHQVKSKKTVLHSFSEVPRSPHQGCCSVPTLGHLGFNNLLKNSAKMTSLISPALNNEANVTPTSHIPHIQNLLEGSPNLTTKLAITGQVS